MAGSMVKSQFANSAAAAREKLVTHALFEPCFSTARCTWRLVLVVFPVPGGPRIRYSDVISWSIRPMPSTVPVACSFSIAVVLEVGQRKVFQIELIER
jgi:hypothetical protein